MDPGLYWQLGELYNARGTPGDLRAAQLIFDDLVWNMNETRSRGLETPADTRSLQNPARLASRVAQDAVRPGQYGQRREKGSQR